MSRRKLADTIVVTALLLPLRTFSGMEGPRSETPALRWALALAPLEELPEAVARGSSGPGTSQRERFDEPDVRGRSPGGLPAAWSGPADRGEIASPPSPAPSPRTAQPAAVLPAAVLPAAVAPVTLDPATASGDSSPSRVRLRARLLPAGAGKTYDERPSDRDAGGEATARGDFYVHQHYGDDYTVRYDSGEFRSRDGTLRRDFYAKHAYGDPAAVRYWPPEAD